MKQKDEVQENPERDPHPRQKKKKQQQQNPSNNTAVTPLYANVLPSKSAFREVSRYQGDLALPCKL